MHFERMAAEYATARPPHPRAVFQEPSRRGVIGPGRSVLEVGAGSGLATGELIAAGGHVTALEPGERLAHLLVAAVPTTTVVVTRLEDADLPDGVFDSAVAATSMHWAELQIGLPILHRALRPGGWLAVWRTVFGDDLVTTPFREHVDRIVAARQVLPEPAASRDERPTMEELADEGWFAPVDTMRWRWSVDLTTEQIRRLFSTFSDWTTAEVEAAAGAADRCGGTVTEHYTSVLHLLETSLPATSGTP
jgi:SAM-dependent methyltransferase